MARLDLELAYYVVAVLHVIYYATGTLPDHNYS